MTPTRTYDFDAYVREIEALVAPPDGPTPADKAIQGEDEVEDDEKSRSDRGFESDESLDED